MHDSDIIALIDGVKREIDRIGFKVEGMCIAVESIIACLHNGDILDVEIYRSFLSDLQLRYQERAKEIAQLGVLAEEIGWWIERTSPD